MKDYISIEERIDQSLIKKVQNDDGKYNLLNTQTGEHVSDIWFDDLGVWSKFSSVEGSEVDIFGWSGLIFLEEPVETPNGAYPYSVSAKNYRISSEGEVLNISSVVNCGIWSKK